MMRDFTKADWMTYSGAENFSDGSEPMLGEYGSIFVIIDGYGISVGSLDEEFVLEEEFVLDGVRDNKEYKLDIAERILKEIKGKTKREIERFLAGLGFECIDM